MSHESKDLQIGCGMYLPMNSKCSEHHGVLQAPQVSVSSFAHC
jgi:hypothetical protein